jgi:uncharacterized protein involved in exopolysaccharide biosynthesis
LADSFDAFRYISYLRARWRWIAAGCIAALILAGVASAMMPRLYTATARILIDLPAGTDLRSPVAISPIYLESLHTYESFASSDSLFLKTIDKFGLRPAAGGAPIESLKRRTLKITILHNTRIMEVSATLADPGKAQQVAQFVAESTVDLNRSLAAAGDQDLIHSAEQQAADIRSRLDATEAAWSSLLAREPIEELKSTIESDVAVRGNLTQQLSNAEVELADATDRLKTAPQTEQYSLRNELNNIRARIDQMKQQIDAVDKRVEQQSKVLSARTGHRDALDAQRKADQLSLTAVEGRLREARSDAGRRGERLIVVDPGIVPERPSSPNIPLNLAAALLLGLALPVLYLTLEMSYREQKALGRRAEIFPAASNE